MIPDIKILERIVMCQLLEIKNLSIVNHQDTVRIRGRVFAKKDCGGVLFLILRDGIHTLQAIVVKNKAAASDMPTGDQYNILRKIENESLIEAVGMISCTQKSVLACSQKWIELQILSHTILSKSVLDLPITLKEAELIEDPNPHHASSSAIAFHKRLDNRVLDMRTSLTQAIFRINDGCLFYMQKYLRSHGFVEIKTSKLISGASEGGANVFTLDYFGKPACLAQSPQLYKQMAIIGGFNQVFEVGPVFRAENSNTTRHLTEFVGVDLEMVIDKTYMEVVRFLYGMFLYVFDKLGRKYSSEMDVVYSFFNVPELILSAELVVIPFSEAISLLQKSGSTIGDLDDFSTEDEKKLGNIVKEQYKTDLYVVTQYPSQVRPFYTMPNSQDERYANAYDFMLRGEEVLSGAQRIHDYDMLLKKVAACGVDEASMRSYLEAFKYGAPYHAGAGIGLERMLKSFLGLPDIRYCNLFPRDPKRLYP